MKIEWIEEFTASRCGNFVIGTLRVIGTSLLELRYWNAARYWNFVIGTSLLELRYWNFVIGTLRVIGTSLWENLRFYWNFVI